MSTPEVGSSRISTRGLVANHRASNIFCWLPPLSASTGEVRFGGLTSSFRMSSVLRLHSLSVSIKMCPLTRAMLAALMFDRTFCPSTSPVCLRFSVSIPIPSLMLAGKPVLVTGDGTSPWTLTRSSDFSVPFVRLFGNSWALSQDFHITNDRAFTWDQIHTAIGRAFGVEARNFHVPTDTLTRYNPEWTGSLTGDKKWTALFDNSKIKNAVGQFTCSEDLDKILAEPVALAKRNLELRGDTRHPNELGRAVQDEDTLMDRIIADQSALGSH